MSKPIMRKVVVIKEVVEKTWCIDFLCHPDLLDEIRDYGTVGKLAQNHSYYLKVSRLFDFKQVLARLKELENETI